MTSLALSPARGAETESPSRRTPGSSEKFESPRDVARLSLEAREILEENRKDGIVPTSPKRVRQSRPCFFP